MKRYMAIWFPHLLTDRTVRKKPELKGLPFVLAVPERGRMIVRAASPDARAKGVSPGMTVADGRAVLPGLRVREEPPGQAEQLLRALARWCIRYSPFVGIDPPDGLVLDVSGCPHLWGGEEAYLQEITRRLNDLGYEAHAAITDTIGAAWAVSRYGKGTPVVAPGEQVEALTDLPPPALRLETPVAERLEKLGLHRISDILRLPRAALRRRFGTAFLTRLDQAAGREVETIEPVRPPDPHRAQLPCLEPVVTAGGIEVALRKLLEVLCARFEKEGTGLRRGIFKAYRVDGAVQHIRIGTSRPSRNERHLFGLFEQHISRFRPDLGFERFVLEAPEVEDIPVAQDALWHSSGSDGTALAELLDRLAGRVGAQAIHRYLPDEHHWPERSFKEADALPEEPAVSRKAPGVLREAGSRGTGSALPGRDSLQAVPADSTEEPVFSQDGHCVLRAGPAGSPERPAAFTARFPRVPEGFPRLRERPSTDRDTANWNTALPRPLELLAVPEAIEVSVPVPDYPPMLFRYKGRVHIVTKADGPERIEQEWWLREESCRGCSCRDYYCVEDEQGGRYWLFRTGSYGEGEPEWYLHGFFA